MPLQGTIESFGISEIFQLVNHQGKTGTLEIHTDDGVARIRFRAGRLVEAWPDRRSPGELIGSLLVRGGLVTPAQLAHALEEQRQSLRRLGDVLIRSGAVRVAEFQHMLTLQHRETVYRLLRLKRGTFRFVPETVEVEEGVSSPMDVGALLMEGFRQIDEWPRLQARIPSEQAVFRAVDGARAPADLDPEARAVLALVDDVTPVRDVVDRARLGEFGGWSALVRLWDLGLVAPAVPRRAVVPGPPRGRRRAPDAVAAAGLTVLAAALLWTFWASAIGNRPGLLDALRAARVEAEQAAGRAQAWHGRGAPERP